MVNRATEFCSTHIKPYKQLVEQPMNNPDREIPELFTYPEAILPKQQGRLRAQKDDMTAQ